MDIQGRFLELMDQRGWSMYRLSKEADLPWSTLRNIIKGGTNPSISTLDIYCKAFGITLSQFFDENQDNGLSEEQRKLIDAWSLLSERDREIVMELLERLNERGESAASRR